MRDSRRGRPLSEEGPLVGRDRMKRRTWLLIVLSISVPIGCLAAAAAGYLWWANSVPAYPRMPVVLPHPNARDDFMAAGRMCKAAHGSLRLGPSGTPLQRNGQTVSLANEPEASLAELR